MPLHLLIPRTTAAEADADAKRATAIAVSTVVLALAVAVVAVVCYFRPRRKRKRKDRGREGRRRKKGGWPGVGDLERDCEQQEFVDATIPPPPHPTLPQQESRDSAPLPTHIAPPQQQESLHPPLQQSNRNSTPHSRGRGRRMERGSVGSGRRRRSDVRSGRDCHCYVPSSTDRLCEGRRGLGDSGRGSTVDNGLLRDDDHQSYPSGIRSPSSGSGRDRGCNDPPGSESYPGRNIPRSGSPSGGRRDPPSLSGSQRRPDGGGHPPDSDSYLGRSRPSSGGSSRGRGGNDPLGPRDYPRRPDRGGEPPDSGSYPGCRRPPVGGHLGGLGLQGSRGSRGDDNSPGSDSYPSSGRLPSGGSSGGGRDPPGPSGSSRRPDGGSHPPDSNSYPGRSKSQIGAPSGGRGDDPLDPRDYPRHLDGDGEPSDSGGYRGRRRPPVDGHPGGLGPRGSRGGRGDDNPSGSNSYLSSGRPPSGGPSGGKGDPPGPSGYLRHYGGGGGLPDSNSYPSRGRPSGDLGYLRGPSRGSDSYPDQNGPPGCGYPRHRSRDDDSLDSNSYPGSSRPPGTSHPRGTVPGGPDGGKEDHPGGYPGPEKNPGCGHPGGLGWPRGPRGDSSGDGGPPYRPKRLGPWLDLPDWLYHPPQTKDHELAPKHAQKSRRRSRSTTSEMHSRRKPRSHSLPVVSSRIHNLAHLDPPLDHRGPHPSLYPPLPTAKSVDIPSSPLRGVPPGCETMLPSLSSSPLPPPSRYPAYFPSAQSPYFSVVPGATGPYSLFPSPTRHSDSEIRVHFPSISDSSAPPQQKQYPHGLLGSRQSRPYLEPSQPLLHPIYRQRDRSDTTLTDDIEQRLPPSPLPVVIQPPPKSVASAPEIRIGDLYQPYLQGRYSNITSPESTEAQLPLPPPYLISRPPPESSRSPTETFREDPYRPHPGTLWDPSSQPLPPSIPPTETATAVTELTRPWLSRSADNLARLCRLGRRASTPPPRDSEGDIPPYMLGPRDEAAMRYDCPADYELSSSLSSLSSSPSNMPGYMQGAREDAAERHRMPRVESPTLLASFDTPLGAYTLRSDTPHIPQLPPPQLQPLQIPRVDTPRVYTPTPSLETPCPPPMSLPRILPIPPPMSLLQVSPGPSWPTVSASTFEGSTIVSDLPWPSSPSLQPQIGETSTYSSASTPAASRSENTYATAVSQQDDGTTTYGAARSPQSSSTYFTAWSPQTTSTYLTVPEGEASSANSRALRQWRRRKGWRPRSAPPLPLTELRFAEVGAAPRTLTPPPSPQILLRDGEELLVAQEEPEIVTVVIREVVRVASRYRDLRPTVDTVSDFSGM